MTETKKKEFWVTPHPMRTALFLSPHRCALDEPMVGFIHVIEYTAFSSLETKLAEYEGAHSCSVKCERPLCVANRKLARAVECINILVGANYHSLLECTAWMGIPEKKRMDFVMEHSSNSRFIADKLIKELES